MALLNYTTEIQAIKTIGQITGILVAHGAREIFTAYDDNGHVEALSFNVWRGQQVIPFRLPVDAKSTLRVLERQKVPKRYMNYAHAVRVAWRIIKDWVEAQMALLETEMASLEQIFLPYMIVHDDQTLYEVMAERQFLLPVGKERDG